MRRGILILLCVMWSSCYLCFSQNESAHGSALQQTIFNLDEELSQEALEELLENPLRINFSSLSAFEAFPLFTRFMAASLYDYISKSGPVISYYELASVPGFDRDIVDFLAPFIDLSVRRRVTLKSLPGAISQGRSQLLIRGSIHAGRQDGYKPISKEELEKSPNSRYIGPPGRVYGQYKYEIPGLIKLSLTSEKDPGEHWGDYVGYSLQTENLGIIERVAIGDFTARFGQGLVLWNAPSLFSSSSTSLLKYEYGITSYSSTDENRAFRGIGLSSEGRMGRLSLLLSARNIDARVVEDGFTSILTTGLHNTRATMERRRNLGFNSIGANYSFAFSKLKVGVTLAGYSYSHPYAGRDSSQIERQSAFGNIGGNAGLDLFAHLGDFRLFGEVASDLTLNPALIAGFVWRKSYSLDLSFAIRYYSDNYFSPLGGAIKRGGNLRGEMGADLIANYRGKGGGSARGWFYYSRGMKLPKCGAELISPIGGQFEILIRADAREERYSLRLQTEWGRGGQFSLSVRGEGNISEVKGSNEFGWMVFAEAVAKLPSGFADASARIAIFNTPSWSNRIYAYERDILYGFSAPAHYGRGFRYYLNIHLKCFKWMDVWFKGSLWRYTDRDYTGEGPSRMEGPSLAELKAEMRFRF